MLSGCRVLIVEDEPIIASSLGATIKDAGGEVVGPFASASQARAALKGEGVLAAAVLDVNVSDGTCTPVLEALHARRIPILIYTGGVIPGDLQRRHPDLRVLSKPCAPARLVAELRRASGRRS
jgi:DNA-binding NtrC family response regulator